MLKSQVFNCNEQYYTPITCGNLTKNPSFEKYDQLPDCRGQLESQYVFCWENLRNSSYTHVGTPDYYHTGFVASNQYPCSADDFSPPTGTYTDQLVLTSSPYGVPQHAYAGIFTYDNYPVASVPVYREYFYQELADVINPGESVTITMQVSLSELSSLATPLQMAFVNTLPSFSVGYAGPVSVNTSQVVSFNPVTNTTGWVQVSGTFVNTTNQILDKIIIGNFMDNPQTESQSVMGLTPTKPGWAGNPACYYVIDDITVERIQNSCCNAGILIMDYQNYNTPVNISQYIPAIYTTSSIFIDVPVLIDQSITLTNKEVRFGPNGKFIVAANKNLFLNNTTLRGCDNMWAGVDATAPNAGFYMTNNSSIEDALIGVHSKGGNMVRVINSSFLKNYTGLQLEDNTNTWTQFTLRKALFDCPGVLKDPLVGTKSYAGIVLKNVNDISLEYNGTVNQNRFQRMNLGIYAENSTFDVSNARFLSIDTYYQNGGWCIYSNNSLTGAGVSVTVDDDKGTTLFAASTNGVGIRGKVNSLISNNQLQAIKQYGIWHEYNNSTTNISAINVLDNTIKNTHLGIGFYECGVTSTHVYNNTIFNSANYSGLFASTGILIQNKSAGTATKCNGAGIDFHLLGNQITRYERGIYATNSPCLDIENNTIHLMAPSSSQHHGIWLENCSQAEVVYNSLTGNYNDWHCIGLRMFKSDMAEVSCNDITTTGHALWFDENCDISWVHHNKMQNYLYGIFMVNQARIGNQYVLNGVPQTGRNEWQKASNTGEYEFFGDETVVGQNSIFYFNPNDANTSSNATNYDFYIDYINPSTPDVTFTGLSGSFFDQNYPSIKIDDSTATTFVPPFAAECNLHSPGNAGGRVVQKFGTGQVLQEVFTPIDEPNHRWMYRQGMLRAFKSYKDTLMQTGLSQPVMDYVDSLKLSDIGKLDAVDQKLDSSLYNEAQLLNGTVVTQDEVAETLKVVNQLLIPYWQQSEQGLPVTVTAGDLQQITAIAQLCLPVYGDGVLKARVFLRRHVSDTLIYQNECEYRWGMEERNADFEPGDENVHEVLISVYPNPANQNVYITSTTPGMYRVMVMDMQGRLVLNNLFDTLKEIETPGWQQGVYIVKIENEQGGVISVSKLVIAH